MNHDESTPNASRYNYQGGSGRQFFHVDERGSVIATSDATGNRLTLDTYDEYGKPGSTNSGAFQYTGQMWLPEAGVYHYKSRAYLPHLGIFGQTDPAGYAAGPNLYAYVRDDPVNLSDPLGSAPLPIVVTYTLPPFVDILDLLGSASLIGEFLNANTVKRALQKTQPICTPTQIRAQDIGEGIGAGGITGAKVGNLVQKGGVAVAAGSAFFLNPTGVLVGGEAAGLGTAIKASGYATAVFGYGVALAAGGDVRNELNDAAVRLLPFSGIYPDSWKNGIKSGLTAAENAVGVPNTGCRR